MASTTQKSGPPVFHHTSAFCPYNHITPNDNPNYQLTRNPPPRLRTIPPSPPQSKTPSFVPIYSPPPSQNVGTPISLQQPPSLRIKTTQPFVPSETQHQKETAIINNLPASIRKNTSLTAPYTPYPPYIFSPEVVEENRKSIETLPELTKAEKKELQARLKPFEQQLHSVESLIRWTKVQSFFAQRKNQEKYTDRIQNLEQEKKNITCLLDFIRQEFGARLKLNKAYSEVVLLRDKLQIQLPPIPNPFKNAKYYQEVTQNAKTRSEEYQLWEKAKYDYQITGRFQDARAHQVLAKSLYQNIENQYHTAAQKDARTRRKLEEINHCITREGHTERSDQIVEKLQIELQQLNQECGEETKTKLENARKLSEAEAKHLSALEDWKKAAETKEFAEQILEQQKQIIEKLKCLSKDFYKNWQNIYKSTKKFPQNVTETFIDQLFNDKQMWQEGYKEILKNILEIDNFTNKHQADSNIHNLYFHLKVAHDDATKLYSITRSYIEGRISYQQFIQDLPPDIDSNLFPSPRG